MNQKISIRNCTDYGFAQLVLLTRPMRQGIPTVVHILYSLVQQAEGDFSREERPWICHEPPPEAKTKGTPHPQSSICRRGRAPSTRWFHWQTLDGCYSFPSDTQARISRETFFLLQKKWVGVNICNDQM